MKFLKILLPILLISSVAWGAARLQNADFMSQAQLIAAGGNASQLLNDTKMWSTVLGETFDQAITNGDLSGGGSPYPVFDWKFKVASGTDLTKLFNVNLTGSSTATTTTFNFLQTANRSINIPNANTTLVGTDTADILSNKTMDLSVNTIKSVTSPNLAAFFNNAGILSPISDIAAFDNLSPLTTKGDLVGFDGASNVRFPVGANGFILAADSTQASGLRWQATGGGVTNVTATAPLSSTGGATPNIAITQSGVATDGYLSSVDWNIFNAKQIAGNYIAGLFGDATANGPGNVLVTVNSVGGSSAAAIHGAELAVNSAASLDVANKLVTRDASGSFYATDITATFHGNLASLTTLGDILYNDGTNDVRLPGNTVATKKFLNQTGTGVVSASPAWSALVAGDIPALPYLSTALTNSHVFVGNGANVATDVAVSGDVTLSNTGIVTLITSGVIAGSYTNATITVNAKGIVTGVGTGTGIVPNILSATCTSCTVTTTGDYKVFSFTSNGTFTITGGGGALDEVLVIGGGGGGGMYAGGGGGAGAMIDTNPTTKNYMPGTYPVTVGAGGTGSNNATPGTNGSSSVFDIYTAIGGGLGGDANSAPAYQGSNGGSGGGSGTPAAAAGTGVSGQGFAGGTGGSSSFNSGGGGGGAGGVGGNAGNGVVSGGGGAGLATTIFGSPVTYAGGGSGGDDGGAIGAVSGGGGAGSNSAAVGGAGVAGTGGGGGGGGNVAPYQGGAGGSGRVVIRIRTTATTPGPYSVFGSANIPVTVSAAGGIAFNSLTHFNKEYIVSTGGAVIVTSNPHIGACTLDGQQLVLVGRSNVNTVQLDDDPVNGLSLNGSWTSGLNEELTLDCDSNFVWVEQSRSN